MERGESVSGLNWKKIIPLLLALIVLGNYLYSTLGVTEEQRILRVVDRAERAVIDKSFFNLEQVLSSHYRDRSGLTKNDLMRLATLYFRSQDQVRVVRMSSDVEILDETEAAVRLRVQVFGEAGGKWGRGLADDSLLGEVFEISLKKESGRWKITAVNPEKRNWPSIYPN
ncbi:MAG: hypothetical protein UZ16_OP3001001094 [Candidatus Hinthialibacteria bacterium OLB16]|nr:MAG: hypothetical protein UZ16_OP3001001094 [Candidatus Hinthialibacteria bacterium OLB16]